MRKINKTQMARTIVRELYLMPRDPSIDHWHVLKLKKLTVKVLRPIYDLAIEAANARYHAEYLRLQLAR